MIGINLNRNIAAVLIVAMASFPVQVSSCLASDVEAEEVVILNTQTKKEPVVKKEHKVVEAKTTVSENSGDSELPTAAWIGIGAGAAAVIGGAIAIGSGGGGGSTPTPEPIVPPTADSLVGPWHGEGHSPGSGLTYSGTYSLYQGGSLRYDLYRSDGVHLVGGGSWSSSEYRLQVNTDHGSHYKGSFVPASSYVTISMSSSNGWDTTLTR